MLFANYKPNSELELQIDPMAWLRLLRIANLPSAVSNILIGFLLAHGSWQPIGQLLLLIAASACLYCGGMVLNDVFDFARDSEERPERPLPSKQISLSTARIVGFGLLIAGVVLAIVAGAVSGNPNGVIRPAVIASLLAVSVWLYDGPLKRTPIAPLIMGGCRTLNVLLGASTVVVATVSEGSLVSGIPNIVLWVAAFVGVLITGVTLLARNEAQENQSRTKLAIAAIVVVAGIVGLACSSYCPEPGIQITKRLQQFFPLVIGAVSITVLRRTLLAVASGSPDSVQTAVVAILRSLILFDASLCLLVCGNNIIYPIVVLALMIPAMVLGRWARST